MKKLTTRHWKLYKVLKSKAKEGIWATRKEILQEESLKKYYPMGEKGIYYEDSAKMLTTDIRELNEHPTIQKIILSNSHKGIKIATKEEAYIQLNKDKANLLKRLSRVYAKYKKMAQDGQYRIVFNTERDFIESFIPSVEGKE